MDFWCKKDFFSKNFCINFLFNSLYLFNIFYFNPLSLNKSRGILNENTFNSFLPTVKAQRFSDSFKGFTFFVEKKVNNQIKNVFIHDTGNNLKNLSPNVNQTNDTTILAESGIIDNKKLLLINGQIISTKKNVKNEIIDFEQLIVSLDSLDTTTIKKPKIQETSTIELLKCLMKQNVNTKLCNDDYKKKLSQHLTEEWLFHFIFQ